MNHQAINEDIDERIKFLRDVKERYGEDYVKWLESEENELEWLVSIRERSGE